MKKYCVYIHETPNGKKYVGITCRKPEYRWNYGKGYEKNVHFSNAIKKYGWENITHTIFASGISKEDACDLEKKLIAEFDTTDQSKGYNQSIGGEFGSLGVVLSEERRRKIGEAHKGLTHSEDAKRRMSEGHMGLPTWNKGRKWTEEEKDVMRKAQSTVKKVLCVETGEIYYGTRNASEKTGINRGSIKDCCNKRKHRKTAGGFHWEYIEEEDHGII